jgi:hypothetical protein
VTSEQRLVRAWISSKANIKTGVSFVAFSSAATKCTIMLV